MKQIIFCICIFFSVAMTQKSPSLKPCDSTQGTTDGPALPELPDQFETRIEANIVQKSYSMEVTEYYDFNNNRGAATFHRRGQRYHSIMQFHNLERTLIYPNNTCSVTNLTSHTFNLFNFTVDATGGHVKGVKDILIFGKKFGETFISGNESVRGIAVDHWQSCLKIEGRNTSFTLDYYFSKDFYNTTSGAQQVPVRAVVEGTGEGFRKENGSLHHFYHVYDFFSYQPGPIKDENVFKVPVGVFCNGSVTKKDMPKLPDQFSVDVEITHARQNSGIDKTLEKFYFDVPSNHLRNDISRPMSRDDYNKYGNNPLAFIYDFNSSLVYIIDKWSGNCTVRGISAKFDSRDVELDRTMKRASDIFNFMKAEFVYQGKKTWRGVPAESWATYDKATNHLQEIFFLDSSNVMEFPPSNGQPSPPNSGGQHPPTPNSGGQRPGIPSSGGQGLTAPPIPHLAQVILGVYDRRSNSSENVTTQMHFYEFTSGHMEADAFDVTACYEMGQQHTYMSLTTEDSNTGQKTFKLVLIMTSSLIKEAQKTGSYQRDVSQNKEQFYSAVRAAIARGAQVSTTRVTSILVEDSNSGSQLKVYFKLLDKLQKKGIYVRGLSLAGAKANLNQAVAAGLNFDVQYPTIEKNFMVMKDSLGEVSPSLISKKSGMTKYSPGSMAGLGIGMLVVGAILGLLVAYVIYKKIDTSVPYRVTD